MYHALLDASLHRPLAGHPDLQALHPAGLSLSRCVGGGGEGCVCVSPVGLTCVPLLLSLCSGPAPARTAPPATTIPINTQPSVAWLPRSAAVAKRQRRSGCAAAAAAACSPGCTRAARVLALTREHTIFQGAPEPNLGVYNDWRTFSSKVSCHSYSSASACGSDKE